MQPDPSELPAITVRCRVQRGRIPLYSPGTVTISEEAIWCRFSPAWRLLLGKDVFHRSRTVTIVRSMLMPPFWRELLELVGEQGERMYATPNFGWGSGLEGDLRLRGYEVVQRRRLV
jgi:hypothetical protein